MRSVRGGCIGFCCHICAFLRKGKEKGREGERSRRCIILEAQDTERNSKVYAFLLPVLDGTAVTTNAVKIVREKDIANPKIQIREILNVTPDVLSVFPVTVVLAEVMCLLMTEKRGGCEAQKGRKRAEDDILKFPRYAKDFEFPFSLPVSDGIAVTTQQRC